MVSFGIKFVIMLRRISVKVLACQFGLGFSFLLLLFFCFY